MSLERNIINECTDECYQVSLNSSNKHPILDLIVLIGKSIQANNFTHIIYNSNDSNFETPFIDFFFFSQNEVLNENGKKLYELLKEGESEKTLNLCRDIIIPWPWNRGRLEDSLVNIGDKRKWGSWKQDYSNHYTILLLPIGITLVNGGNHSITAGIAQGEGVIKPNYVYDISSLYQYIYTDGKYYYRKHDNSILGRVNSFEFAAIFEIGRLMKEKSLSF